MDGIRWRVPTRAPWRDIPAEYGPWQTVHGLFRRWQRSGVWAEVLTGLQTRADAAGLITWKVFTRRPRADVHAGKRISFRQRKALTLETEPGVRIDSLVPVTHRHDVVRWMQQRQHR
ncbi:transposase [Streptomyces sp. NPDC055214]